MARATPMRVSFNAGELSPLLDGRTDLEKYYKGCSLVENIIATVQGAGVRRGGLYFGGEVKNSSQRAWLRRFTFNVTQSYMLEFGHQYIRFYTNRGQVLEASKVITGITKANPAVVTSAAHGFSNGDYVYISGVVGMTEINGRTCKVAGATANTFQLQDVDGNNIDSSAYTAYSSGGTVARIYQIATPYNVADLTDSDGNCTLSFEQSGDVLYISHGSYQTQKLSRLGATNWTIAGVALSNGPFQDNNTNESSTVYVSATFNTTVTGTANAGGLIRLTVGTTAGLSTGNKVIIYGVGGTTEANGEWVVTVIDGTHFDLQSSAYSHAYTAGGTVQGGVGTSVTLTATASIFNAGHVGTQFYLEQPINGTLLQWEVGTAITAGAQRRSGVNNYIAISSGTTGSVKPTHTAGAVWDGQSGGVQWLYYDSGYGVVSITTQAGTSATGTIVSKIPLSCYNAAVRSSIYAFSLFSASNGWPEIVTIFRERLSFMKGLTGAMSVSGDYENFAKKIDGAVTADAAIRFVIPDANPPRWMREGNDLLIGTAGKEIAVGEVTTADPLGPSNIRARKQTSYGSRRVEPVDVGSSVIFVTRSGRKLREARYSFETNGYQSNDLTVLSEHIAKAGISQISYQQEPYSIIWGCTTSGELLGFTFDREQDVLAWTRHPVGGGGIVESVQCIPSPDGKGDDLWCIVRRTINGVTRRYVEWMVAPFDGDDSTIENAFYVDGGITYNGAATTTINGIYHLKGCTVDILADGAVHPQKTVSASGSVTLDYAASVVQIGLPCPAKLRSMRVNEGSPLGTAQGKLKRMTRLIVRFLKSLGGKFGPTEAKLDPVIYHQGDEYMDTPPPLFTGDKNLLWPGGYETDGYICIVNDTPTPMTIINLVPDLQVYEY